ncbi:MAG: hypothetical protein KC897_08255 [Candidatus Omnitrophica bacterium]|nr:hypothetical protein [Candidatus Omnitrophota bacterium]MCB9721452.1 hypothetical protein [Candidatus Omnitrophota bacterium]
MLIVYLMAYARQAYAAIWQPMHVGKGSSPIRNLYVHGEYPGLFFAASTEEVYQKMSDDTFDRVISLSQSGQRIQDMAFNADQGLLLLATTQGLYEVRIRDGQSKRIYSSSDDSARDCRRVVLHSGRVYLGTGRGLLTRLEGESQWRAVSPADHAPVYDLDYAHGQLFCVTDSRVILFDPDTGAPQSIHSGRTPLDESEDTDTLHRRSVAVTSTGVLLLSADGNFLIRGSDSVWRSPKGGPPPFRDIRAILPLGVPDVETESAEPFFLVSSERGVYLYGDGHWQPLQQGMGKVQTFDLAMTTADGRIWAVGEDDVYLLDRSELLTPLKRERSQQPTTTRMLSVMGPEFEREPGIAELHRLAIAYADVHPDKIIRWKRQARLKAWVPNVDIGVDAGRGWSRSDSLWGSSSSGGTHYVGPDDKSSSRDIGWDVSLSWDLSDVIWSTDQTSIDARAKLMVELREDIINQVTRLYFERRRLQIEMRASGPDAQPVWTYELRIAELTALLDGLTGGGFSRSIDPEAGE